VKRRAGVAAALTAAVVVLAGCSGGSDDGSDSGSDGDALIVYSGRNEALVGPVLEDFTAATGIAVDVRYGDTAGMAAQLLEEGDRTPAAVFLSQDAGALGALAAEGLLSPLPSEVVADVPAQYRDPADAWVAVTGRARAMVIDPDEVAVPDAPASVYDLTGDAWRSRVAIAPANASFQSFVTGMRVADGDAAAEQWLADMAANDVQTYENNVQILEAVEAGQVALGLVNHYYWFERAAEVGTDAMRSVVAYTEAGDPGSLVNVSGVAVLASGAEDPRALQLVEYLLSEEAQTSFAEETFEYPMIASVPPAADLVPLAELQGPAIDLSDLASLPETIEMIQNAGLL
jgi:iron(III) transport system substrate-binding protein